MIELLVLFSAVFAVGGMASAVGFGEDPDDQSYDALAAGVTKNSEPIDPLEDHINPSTNHSPFDVAADALGLDGFDPDQQVSPDASADAAPDAGGTDLASEGADPGDGDDSQRGSAADDLIAEIVSAGESPEVEHIIGQSGDDVIEAQSFALNVDGGEGADIIDLTGVRVVADGAGGDDRITVKAIGDAGFSRVSGGSGADFIDAGHDQESSTRVSGDDGNDFLVVRPDTIIAGGEGMDTFLIAEANQPNAPSNVLGGTILDFDPAEDFLVVDSQSLATAVGGDVSPDDVVHQNFSLVEIAFPDGPTVLQVRFSVGDAEQSIGIAAFDAAHAEDFDINDILLAEFESQGDELKVASLNSENHQSWSAQTGWTLTNGVQRI